MVPKTYADFDAQVEKSFADKSQLVYRKATYEEAKQFITRMVLVGCQVMGGEA